MKTHSIIMRANRGKPTSQSTCPACGHQFDGRGERETAFYNHAVACSRLNGNYPEDYDDVQDFPSDANAYDPEAQDEMDREDAAGLS